jgi:hypothetical protein
MSIWREAGAMADESQAMDELPLDALQQQREAQQALLENAARFADAAMQCMQGWHLRWPEPSAASQVAAISTMMRAALDKLRQALARPEGPALPEAAEALNTLLGTQDVPGPLARLQALITGDRVVQSPEAQRLLSELDMLTIRLNGLRAQWQDYLSLSAPRQSTKVQPITEPLPSLPPLPPNRVRRSAAREAALSALLGGLEGEQPHAPTRQRSDLSHAPAGTLKVTLALLAVLVLIVVFAYEAAVHLPLTKPGSTQNLMLAPTASRGPLTGQPTSTPPALTDTVTTRPTASPTIQPTAAPPPNAGAAALSVNPPQLTIPCPGTGAAALQLINTGAAPLDWQAAVNGPANEIWLDGAASEQGHLSPGDEAIINVTAQARGLQGTISITYTGAPYPIMIAYRVNC